jgi:anti-sigma regulatory factor (Ser/Thr protein kinase)/HAMP domain-containing protein
MFRRLGVRGKVLATLVTPAIVLVIAAAYIIGLSVVDAMRAQQTSDLVAALEYQDAAGTTFAQERSLNIVAMIDNGPSGEQASLALLQGTPEVDENGKPVTKDGAPVWAAPAAQAQTITALDERDEALLDIDISMLDQRVKTAVAETIEDRAAITDVQKKVAAGRLTEQAATEAYGGYIDGALEVMDAIADTSEDRQLGTRLEAYHSMDQLMLTNTYERPVVALTLGIFREHPQGEEASRSLALRAADLVNLGDREWDETQDLYDRIPGDYQVPGMDGIYGSVRDQIARGDLASIQETQAGAFREESAKWVDEARIVRDAVREDASAFAQERADVAANRAYLTGGIAIAALGFSIITALVIARRLVSPLRRLTQAAGVVRDRLPTLVEQVSVPGQGPSIDLDPITVESSDEIGQLAAAFNDVNRTTIDVAREQAALRGSIAEMFVNVARRDQVLLNRQLAFLDDLERSEEDPSTLSNLFRLDHLATRMRRNAESLLVLAGIDSGRRVRQPMPVSDVIRTASSEIELYDRVRLNLVVDPMMLGHNALNAAHLLAELLENATMFSEPHTPVEVTTARDEQFVTVVVRDHGLGMNPAEVAEANRKVLSHAASDAVGAQRLGLYVVGRLSDRLGAQVEFGVGEGGTGTEVTVRFPAVLFMPDNAMPLPMPTDPLEANTQAAASQFNGGVATGPGTGAMRGAPANGFGSPAISAASPATTSLPQQGGLPVPTGTSQIAAAAFAAQPAPVAQPVDINALTDGTTALGLARRRSSTAAQPMAETTPTGSIVLPEIQTPSLPQEYQGDDNAWAPPSNVSEGSSLPSRQRAPQQPEEPVAPVFEETTPVAVDVDQRSALFSSFRSLNTIDPVDAGGPQSLQLDPVTQDPAALPGMSDTDVMRFPAAGGAQAPAAPAPARSFGGPPTGFGGSFQGDDEQSQGFGADAQQGPDSSFEALPAFEELMADLPSRRSTGSGAQQGAKPAQQKRGLFGRRPGQPATGELRAYQPQERPASRPIQTVSSPAADVPAFGASNLETQSFQAAQNLQGQSLPPQNFQMPSAPPQDFQDLQVPQDFQAPYVPQGVPAPQAAGPMTGAFPVQAPAPAQPQQPVADPTYQRGYQEGYQRAVQESLTSAMPAVPSAPAGGTVPMPTQAHATVPAPAHGSNPFVDAAPRAAAPAPAPAPERAPTSFDSGPATQAVPMAAVQQSFEAPVREPIREFSEPYPTGAVYDPTYGSPAPLAKRAAGTDGDGKDPLDPEYVRDSVEARSEWTASAVLYEEMTSLLRRGAFQEDDVKENDSYRPAAVNTEVANGGLTRRTRGASGTGADPTVERLSARIDRDPEQLRSRLSAFQSATARGRSESVEEGETENANGKKADGDSTWAPSTVNHVPDSAPQSR